MLTVFGFWIVPIIHGNRRVVEYRKSFDTHYYPILLIATNFQKVKNSFLEYFAPAVNASVVFTGDKTKYGKISGTFKQLPLTKLFSEVLGGAESQKSSSPNNLLKW